MVMRHFGFGIGHVNSESMACQRNNEDDGFSSGSDSQAESDAMDLMPAQDSRASDLENVDISIANDDLDPEDSDSESSSSTDTSSSSSGSSGSDTQSDDDGYASF
jgi:hypothetical protein